MKIILEYVLWLRQTLKVIDDEPIGDNGLRGGQSLTPMYTAGDHVTFVYGNIVSQQIAFAIILISRSNFY